MKTRPSYLVTGARSELGRSIVEDLLRHSGGYVLATSRQGVASKRLDKRRGEWLARIDLLERSGLRRLQRKLAELPHGPLHVVNCVGHFPGFKTLAETDLADAKRVFDENVVTVVATAATVLPHMIQRGGGHFVVFSSHAVPQAFPLMSTFLSAKAALETLVRSIANDHAKDGVVANALALATLDTRAERSLLPEGDHKHWLKPRRVAAAVRHLVESPIDAAVNGNTLQLFDYSRTYFGTGYLQRIGRSDPGKAP